MKPSDEQQNVIEAQGKIIVLAPPGSGKTYTLCEKAKYYKQNTRKKMIILTFSNKAAEEINNRIENKENIFVGTIHSFAQHLVSSRGHLIGVAPDFTIVSEEKEKEIILKEIIRDSEYLSTHMAKYINGEEDIKKPIDYIRRQKLKFLVPDDLLNNKNEYSELYFELFNAYFKKMNDYNLIDFDDLLYYAHKILSLDSTKNMIKNAYYSLFVDEAQDLNSSQYEIIRLLSNNINEVMLIGDPEQSLYGFMNSSSKFMEKTFVEDFDAIIYKFKNNYRSSKAIVNLLNKITSEQKSLNIYPIDGILKYNLYKDEVEEAKNVVELIKQAKNEYGENEIAVLGRNRFVFKYIIEQLEEKDIEYNTGYLTKVEFETTYVSLLFLLTRYFRNEKDPSVEREIAEYLDTEKFSLDIVDKNLVNICKNDDFRKYKNSIINLKDSLIEKLEDKSDEEALFLINELDLYISCMEIYNRSQTDSEKTVLGFVNDFLMGKTINYSTNGVSLLTIHKSKGLEFKVVFFVGLNEGTLPDYRANDSKKIEEEKNNAFVGFSRAKIELYLSSVKYKMMPWGSTKYVSESRFLKQVKELLNI